MKVGQDQKRARDLTAQLTDRVPSDEVRQFVNRHHAAHLVGPIDRVRRQQNDGMENARDGGNGNDVGDVDGDMRDDFLCHDTRTGDKWIDLADTAGQFGGTDFYRAAQWCNHDAGILR